MEDKNEIFSQPTQPGILPPLFDPHFLDFLNPPPSPSDLVISPPSDTDTYDTQLEATQPIVDPRRLGQQGGSGLSDKDVADICCILHPLSLPAYKAAADIWIASPQHAISADSNARIREISPAAADLDDFELESEDLIACDIALRLSSALKDPLAGFVFGRAKTRCDVVIGDNQLSKRISNVHFRIHINEYGVIMLEDQSTNGTAVDGTLLRGKDKENGQNYRHTLQQGSIVVLTMTPPEVDYRFIVRIPQRDDEADRAYQHNLTAYFLRMNVNSTANANANANDAPRKPNGGKNEPINLFPIPGTTDGNKTQPDKPDTVSRYPTVGRSIREWKGGNKYNKVGYIGKGAFAVVYKITDKFNGIPYAAKELEKRRFMKNGVLDQKVDSEMNIMRKIQHPNVVRFIEHVDWEDKLYIIMEFVPNGDLGSLINQSENGHMSEPDVRVMATQLLGALGYLHDKGITHRDVKPDNILIATANPISVKLTDFGLSKMIDSEDTFLRTFCGTLLYCAPEVYSEYREYDNNGVRTRRDKRSLPPQRYGHAVDIWSLAGVLFYSLCGYPPYRAQQGVSYQELLNQIMTMALDIRPLQRANVSEAAIRAVRTMLHIRPDHRATIEEVEASSWITGNDDSYGMMSMEEDVPSIIDDYIDPELEIGASQLSIQNDQPRQLDDSDIFGNENVLDVNHIQRGEIPSSFDTNDDLSIDDLEYVPATAPNQNAHGNRNGRLFGEVNLSELGDVLPASQFDFTQDRQISLDDMQDSQYTQSESGGVALHDEVPRHIVFTAPTTLPPSMPPPPPPVALHPKVMAIRGQETRPARSASPQFTESIIEQLNMDSTSTAHLVLPGSPAATVETADPSTSLRRSRYEYEGAYENSDWMPDDMRLKRRRQSNREIHVELPVSVFWDPRDKNTHHNNYPRLTNFEYEAFKQYAKEKGEEFLPGGKTFENTMQSFKTSASRSPSAEVEGAVRAQSEPTKTEGRRMMMKRDYRQLSEERQLSEGPQLSRETSPNDHFSSFNRQLEVHPSAFPPHNDPSNSVSPFTSPPAEVFPFVGNDFQEPKKILARFMATPDSCLPTITFNITDPFTSWGRSSGNTLRSTVDKRVPYHAFKLILFKKGFYSDERSGSQEPVKWSAKEQDMTFYISTKAANTIFINNVQLRSHASDNPNTESKYWGELRHDDVVTVWWDRWTNKDYIRFRFECLWGRSREPRYNDGFDILEKGSLLMDIEKTCLAEEEKMLREQSRRKLAETDFNQIYA